MTAGRRLPRAVVEALEGDERAAEAVVGVGVTARAPRRKAAVGARAVLVAAQLRAVADDVAIARLAALGQGRAVLPQGEAERALVVLDSEPVGVRMPAEAVRVPGEVVDGELEGLLDARGSAREREVRAGADGQRVVGHGSADQEMAAQIMSATAM